MALEVVECIAAVEVGEEERLQTMGGAKPVHQCRFLILPFIHRLIQGAGNNVDGVKVEAGQLSFIPGADVSRGDGDAGLFVLLRQAVDEGLEALGVFEAFVVAPVLTSGLLRRWEGVGVEGVPGELGIAWKEGEGEVEEGRE